MFIATTDVAILTADDGSCTAYSEAQVNGFIRAIAYIPDSVKALATTADIVVTSERTGTAILTAGNIGTALKTWYPQAYKSKVSDGTDTTTQVEIPVGDSRIKIVVAQGGDACVGKFRIFYA